MKFKQGVPTLELSLERGTPDVPADRQYHVVLRREVIFSSTSRKKALAFYQSERERLFELHGRPDPPAFDREQWLLAERANADIKAMRSEWLQSHGPQTKRGGKGGRGGV